jgi:hypothetical protein
LNLRCNILPEPQFAERKALLAERLGQVAHAVTPANFASLLDALMQEVLQQGFREAGAQEGTVWLLDEPREHLMPAYNTGPNAGKIVGQFRQPLTTGLICMVLASEQPFLENEVHKNAQQSKLLDTTLEVQTYSLIAVPFYLLKQCQGVVSCVQLKTPQDKMPEPRGFGPASLQAVQRAASLLTRLLEYRLLSSTVAWTCD